MVVDYYIEFIGEPVGIRTRDLLIKSQLLYRLSYGLAAARQDRARACDTSIMDDDARGSCKVNIAVPIRGPHAKRPGCEILARR